MRLILRLLFIIINTLVFTVQAEESKIGIYEELGKTLPMDLSFFDEDGHSVKIQELTHNKPFILAFVYYKCPGICQPVMQNISKLLDRLDLETDKDFTLLVLSIDPKEKYELANNKKKNFLHSMEKKIAPNGWRFLTGTSENIKIITDRTGFAYQKNKDGTFTHTSTLIALSPNGKITRYIYGTSYLPLDVKFALMEASAGRVNPTIAKMLRYCFSYDPEGRRYTFNILRVGGAVTTLAGLSFFAFLVLSKRKRKK